MLKTYSFQIIIKLFIFSFLKNSSKSGQDRDWLIKLLTSLLTLVLKIGAILASLQTSRKIPVTKEVLSILAKDFKTIGQAIFSIKLEILSGPHNFLVFICTITRTMSSSVTFRNWTHFEVTSDVAMFECWVSEITFSDFLLHKKINNSLTFSFDSVTILLSISMYGMLAVLDLNLDLNGINLLIT